jgi:transposase
MQQRIEFGLKAMGALNFRALCQEYGISTKTGYKWKERFLREGMRGMQERARRPKSHADELAEETVCAIIRLKLAHGSWGPRKIRELYRRRHGEVASESSFKRVLERAGLTQTRWRRRAKEAGRLSAGREGQAPTWTFGVKLKHWVSPIRPPWIYGGEASTMSGRTKLWQCVVRRSCIGLQNANMKVRQMNWTIPKCACVELAPKAGSKSIINTSS